jgi:hypothetical protein
MMRTTPSPDPMMQQGNELAMQLLAAMRTNQQQMHMTTNRYQSWRAQSRPEAFLREDGNGLLEAVVTELLFGGLGALFGGPSFDMLHDAATVANGVNIAMQDSTAPQLQRFVSDTEIEQLYKKMYEEELRAQAAQQAKMARTRKVLTAMLAALDAQEAEAPIFAPRAQEEIAGDVLRRPRVAQFKQNRHSSSMDCIRESFIRSANTITPPLFAQPRYKMAG